MIFSHSRLKTFENCPRKFAFQYIEKPDIERRDSVEAFMGTAVHNTLENLYKSIMMERVPKWEETRDFYEDFWAKNWRDDILIVHKQFSADDYRNVGRRCLQDYFVAHFPFAEGRVLALEERILVDLDGTGKYKLQGFIDRLQQQEDGTIEIHDYKTSRRLPSQEEINRERQLALYQIGIEERWPDTKAVTLIWHYMRSNRTLVSKRSPASLEDLKRDTIELIDTIGYATERNEFPPHETMLCDWCEFYPICPAKRHIVATSEMTKEQFDRDDGVRLADEFVAAKQVAEEASAAVDEARKRLVAFTDQEKLTRVVGHSFSVSVSRRKDVSLPASKTPQRLELEAIVKASGKWEEVSDLSRYKLPKAVQTDMFDAMTRQNITKFLSEQERITVTTRKIVRDDLDEEPDMGPQ